MRAGILPYLALIFLAAACDTESSTAPSDGGAIAADNGGQRGCAGLPKKTKEVVLTPANSLVAVGGSVTITATNQKGIPIPACALVWSSTAPSTATVSSVGVVTGVAVGGPVTIKAKSRDDASLKGIAFVTVQAAPVLLSSLELIYAERDNSNLTIYAMMGDGSGRRVVNVGTGPTWTGNLVLARGAWQDNSIYAMDSLGGNRHQIVGSGPSYAPDLSPEGLRFVFMYGDCAGGHSLATANADGSGLATLPICSTQPPRWSPLGNRIAFSFGPTISTANVDGSDVREVTTLSGEVAGVVWSPDGTQLMFSYAPAGSAYAGIFIINADGTNLRQITTLTSNDWVQDWSLTGDWILLFSTRSGDLDLWAMRADGSGAVDLTPGRAPPDAGHWKR